MIAEIDNEGTVGVYMRGHGKDCPYVKTLPRAAYVVAKGMEFDLRFRKIRNCSDKGAV